MKYIFLSGLLLAFATQVTWAADIQAGKVKAASCLACHGPDGIATIPGYPHLAGQKAAYLVTSLKSFKNGERTNSIMSPMAAPLSDEDIADLAAFFASLDQCK